ETSVLDVENDKDMIQSADYVLDIGRKAGRLGGKNVSKRTPQELLKENTLTASYLNGTRKIHVAHERIKWNGKFLRLEGATGNNLKNVSVEFPLGTLICVTGVSGSGKSTLINQTLYPILNQHFFNAVKK